jgi:hypothetical protein
MGREAVCTCDWAGTVAEVKALLETSELILRGEIRRRVAFSEIARMCRCSADGLRFKTGGERVELCLGLPSAAKWAAAITRPAAVACAEAWHYGQDGGAHDRQHRRREPQGSDWQRRRGFSARDADLIVACVDTLESLKAALKQAKAALLESSADLDGLCKGAGTSLERNCDSNVAARAKD